jgi:tricarballylate dehydrogenase
MDYDVIVVGAGNAAHAAAVSASNEGAAHVLMLEKATEELRGGNTHYSGGLYRFAFDHAEQLLPLVPDVEEQVPGFLKNVPPYPKEAFWRDLRRVTQGRTDPELAELLISKSYETVCWVAEQGVKMEAAVSLAAVQFEGEVKWPSGAVIRSEHEGVGLSKMWFEIAASKGIELRYQTGAQRLLQDDRGRVSGVLVRGPEGLEEIGAKAVILGCGGFESNPEWRARYLNRPWDTARVRGTRYNNGDGLRMALELGALPYGQWSGSHGTPIDADAPPFGDRVLTDKTNRLSYPLGVVVNVEGERFIDEGEDFQLYTYAKTGGAVLGQPGGVAYQLFDSRVLDLLEPRYSTGRPIVAETLEDLAEQLPMDTEHVLETLREYNAHAARGGRFDPTVLDGLHSDGLAIEKSNWALPLEQPPFRAYPITGGITFTFGGVKVSERAEVMHTDWRPIDGLFACGEMVGGLFHYNYPGGSGLMSGAVFGRIAGRSAAEYAASTKKRRGASKGKRPAKR